MKNNVDPILANLIMATPGLKDYYYSNIKELLYLQIDESAIYNMTVAIRLQPIINLAAFFGMHSICIMDLIPVDVIRAAEEYFISLN